MKFTRIAATARLDATMTLRSGESLLLMLGIPLVFLAFFSSVDILPIEIDEPIDFLVPGVLALAVLSTALVNLAISVGFDREYGVLRRLAVTPLLRTELLLAKASVVFGIIMAQAALIIALGAILGFSPNWSGLALAAVSLLLAVLAFTGLALTIAGSLKGLTTLATANGLYLLLLLLGGMIIPPEELPGPFEALAGFLPTGAFAEILQGSIGTQASPATSTWLLLGAWALAAPMVAIWRFDWEP